MSNPLLAGIKLPGRIFQLPSKGLFYKNGELADDVKNGEVHVRPMSAIDEIHLKNPDQQYSGTAIDEVFSKCIEGVLKPSELLAKDIDALMIYLRAVTYGEHYEFVAIHPCEMPDHLAAIKDPLNISEELDAEMREYYKNFRKEHSYVANVESMINNIQFIDPTTLEDSYTINVPELNQVIKLHPNRYLHVLEIVKQNSAKKLLTVKERQENLILMLLGVIESINGVTDKEHIREWCEAIPSPIVNKLADKVESIEEWGANLKWGCICKDCGKSFSVDIPINPVSFFTE
jgi:hypothetical protein